MKEFNCKALSTWLVTAGEKKLSHTKLGGKKGEYRSSSSEYTKLRLALRAKVCGPWPLPQTSCQLKLRTNRSTHPQKPTPTPRHTPRHPHTPWARVGVRARWLCVAVRRCVGMCLCVYVCACKCAGVCVMCGCAWMSKVRKRGKTN